MMARATPAEGTRSFAAAARRDQIVGAAIEVLAAEGFSAASLGAIGDRVGVSKGVLTYHFSSKAELLGEVVRRVLTEAEEWMTPRLRGATSYRAALHAYITANLEFLERNRTGIVALTEIVMNARAVPGLAESFTASQRKAIDDLAALFEGGRAAGEFGDVPAHMLALSLRATIDAVSTSLRDDPDLDLSELRRGLLALFDHATAAPATQPGQHHG